LDGSWIGTAKNTEGRLKREALMRIAAQWDRLADHNARKESEGT
jgi:hypothetical protein